jgi:ABC-type multidrug transport system fused ATPase/permease subunit
MHVLDPAKPPGSIPAGGPTLMPHRLAEIANGLAMASGWIAALSGGVGFITGDGVAAAITVVGLALVVTLSRMTPALATAIREVGSAYAEYRGKLKRELADTTAKADENTRAIESVRAEAAREVAAAKAEVARLKEENAADLVRVEADASRKRHAMADRLQAALLSREVELEEQKLEMARLKARLGLTDRTHAEAINTVADTVKVIADQMQPPVPVETPHVDPIPPNGSGIRPSPAPEDRP